MSGYISIGQTLVSQNFSISTPNGEAINTFNTSIMAYTLEQPFSASRAYRLLFVLTALVTASAQVNLVHSIDPKDHPELFKLDVTEQHGTKVPSFIKGLPGRKYNISLFGAKPTNASLIQGISYELCETACLNSKCGSFSYCPYDMECILTSVFTPTDNLVLDQAYCNVMRRNVRAFFYRNDKPVLDRIIYNRRLDAMSIHECTDSCIADPDCHAYYSCGPCEFARSDATCRGHTLCFYPSMVNSSGSLKWTEDNKKANSDQYCGLYIRDYFSEYDLITDRLVTNTSFTSTYSITKMRNKPAYECAHTCSAHISECDGFQYCQHPSGDEALYICETFTYTKPTVTAVRKKFQTDDQCQLWKMKSNSPKAHLHDLMISDGNLYISPNHTQQVKQAEISQPSGQESVWIWLYVTMAMLCLAIFGIIYLAAINLTIREKVEQAKDMLLRNMSKDDDLVR